MNKRPKPIALVILDGWGIGDPDDPSNAIARAATPNMDDLAAAYPTARIGTSGEAVGLPEGQMGNSEVGHLNIGAGRIVYQEFTRITKAIRDGSLFTNPVLASAIAASRDKGGALHLMGLVSDGGVHSHITHIYGLLEMARRLGQTKVFVHAFLDGRDTPPQSALEYIGALEEKMAEMAVGRIATVSGRYYAMDRDKRWERVEKAYAAMVYREGQAAASARQAVEQAYARGETDEFVMPTVVEGCGDCGIKPGDGAIFFNFRPDRARQMTRAFVDPGFTGFVRRRGFFPLHFVTMTRYDESLDVPVAFPPQSLDNTLGQVISQAGLFQLRIAETEKYAHVTYFFSGGEETPFPGEERVLIPSPKVATYDLKPEMSAYEVTDRVVAEIAAGKHDLIVLNYANCDMVGHTGVFEAARQAVEAVDKCVGRVVAAVKAQGGIALITADHGNAEQMADPVTGEPFTAHTTNDVPLILVSDAHRGQRLKPGILADLAPTILALAGMEIPSGMTGENLIQKSEDRNQKSE